MSGIEVPSPLLPQQLEVRQQLAAALCSAANALEHDGCPPSAALIQSLTDFLQTEETLAKEMERRATEAEVIRQAAREEAEKFRTQREEKTLVVRRRVQDFQSLCCQDTNLELEHQQQLAAQFEQQLPLTANHPEEQTFQRLLHGEHCWTQLLQLVAEGDQLNDEDWDRLCESVRRSFEPSLANAALRGRLSLPARNEEPVAETAWQPDTIAAPVVVEAASVAIEEEPEPTVAATELHIEQAPPAVEIDTDETNSATSNATLDEMPSGSVFDELTESDLPGDSDSDSVRRSGVLVTAPQDSTEPDSLHNALFEGSRNADSGDSRILRQQHHFTDPTGQSCELATEVLSADQERRQELLPELVQALIFEGRSGLAYHLARCMETAMPPVGQFLPAWTIRVWTLGNAVLFPTGQLAGRLQEDFTNFKPKSQPSSSPEQDLALSLFIRAAALRPAVIAPSTKAAHILRSFEMSSDTSQLYNYCMRIGTYGEKLQGVSPTSFKRTDAQDTGLETLRQLRDDIQFWLSESTSYSVRYSITNPLFTRAHWSLRTSTTRRYAAEVQIWQQWQDTLQTAHRIIRNIIQDRRDAVAETRHEMDRLALLTTGDRGPSGLKSNDEMRNYLLQTITFGQRWVSLHSTAKPESFIPDDLNELRSEIERRHDSVADELRDLADRYPQPEVQMALGCLMLAMDQLRDLVNPEVPTETQEPDARHLVQSELLKIPGLRFSSNWQPESDPETLLDMIVKYLADPNPDWNTAVQLQLGQDNLDAAEKISTLPVWNRTEQAQLQTVLTRYRKQHRDELWKDLQETEALIEEATRLQLFSEQDRVGFAARLERLRRGLSLSRHHAGDASEITQLRQAVERRRTREATLTRERLEKLESPGGATTPPPATTKGWKMEF